MIPKLVIFDCDGVLVDTEGPVQTIVTNSLRKYGLDIAAPDYNSLFVGGTMQGAADEARRRGADLPSDWVDQIYHAMFARLEEGVDLIDGVMDVIHALDAAGIPRWIASNGPMEKMRRSLGLSGLWDMFEGRILSREGTRPKPAPDMVLHAMQAEGIAAIDTVMIDDSVNGAMAGINAGVRTLGFAQDGQDDRLRAIGAEVVNTMAEVKQALFQAP